MTKPRRMVEKPLGAARRRIVIIDSTNFTTLFGGTESLENFWRNLATL
jgi:hypothetical protein